MSVLNVLLFMVGIGLVIGATVGFAPLVLTACAGASLFLFAALMITDPSFFLLLSVMACTAVFVMRGLGWGYRLAMRPIPPKRPE